MTTYLVFFVSMTTLLIISQRNVGAAMFVGAFILDVLIIPESLLTVFGSTSIDPTTILMAVVVGLISIIEDTESFRSNGQFGRQYEDWKESVPYAFSSHNRKAFMSRGALLSAHLIEKRGNTSNEKKAGLNV